MLALAFYGDPSATVLLGNLTLVGLAFIPHSHPRRLRDPLVLGLCAEVQQKTGAACRCCWNLQVREMK